VVPLLWLLSLDVLVSSSCSELWPTGSTDVQPEGACEFSRDSNVSFDAWNPRLCKKPTRARELFIISICIKSNTSAIGDVNKAFHIGGRKDPACVGYHGGIRSVRLIPNSAANVKIQK